MHIEFLVEDISGKTMLERLLPKIVGSAHTYNIHSYRGVGRIPAGLKPKATPDKRILLDNLPRLLAGYGSAWASSGYEGAVIVVCDLDKKNLAAFDAELETLLGKVSPQPKVRFCIAIEEGEAWFLGDFAAVLKAYPSAKTAVLARYRQDSICGTWEVLADAISPGGAAVLAEGGYQAVGAEKSQWANNITPHMVPAVNKSPSFQSFCKEVQRLTP